jgi:hypothetical protein
LCEVGSDVRGGVGGLVELFRGNCFAIVGGHLGAVSGVDAQSRWSLVDVIVILERRAGC